MPVSSRRGESTSGRSTKSARNEAESGGSAGRPAHDSGAEGECSSCGKQSSSLKRCGKCRSVFYCSEGCQRGDWKKHKRCCHTPPRAQSPPVSSNGGPPGASNTNNATEGSDGDEEDDEEGDDDEDGEDEDEYDSDEFSETEVMSCLTRTSTHAQALNPPPLPSCLHVHTRLASHRTALSCTVLLAHTLSRALESRSHSSNLSHHPTLAGLHG